MDPQALQQDPNTQDPNMMQDSSMPTPSSAPIQDGNPYFMGQHALIKFSSGEEGYGPAVYWLVDKEDHTIRAFESHMAMDAAFGQDLEAALTNAVTINPPATDQSGEITEGVLTDFSILGPEYAIKEDGTAKPLDFSPHQLKGRYGKAINEDQESLAVEVVDGFLNLLKKNENKTGITSAFLNKMKSDEKLMAFYVSAMAYGEYTLGDIFSDLKRRFNSQ